MYDFIYADLQAYYTSTATSGQEKRRQFPMEGELPALVAYSIIFRAYALPCYAAGRLPCQPGVVLPAGWVVLVLVWVRSVVWVISWEISSTTSEMGME